MGKIPLANDVTIEYDEETVKSEADYRFVETVPELGEFARDGVRFSLTHRADPRDSNGFLYTFVTKDKHVKFKLEEETFKILIEDKAIVKEV